MNSKSMLKSRWGMAMAAPLLLGALTTSTAQDVITISTLNAEMSERWPQPATVVIRRTGGLRAVTVPIAFGGTATRSTDYASSAGSSVTIPVGSREVWLQLKAIKDNLTEGTETVQVTVQPSPAYTVGGTNSASLNLIDNSGVPTDEEATRLLIQAGFGADPDELADVKMMGIEGWINQQLTRPKGYMEPLILARYAANLPTFHHDVQHSFWKLMMRRRNPPGGGTVATDVLRQRVAYSLSQIFVVSQVQDAVMGHPQALANFYDRLLDGSFGSFRKMLMDVTRHPLMGIYLSAVGNRKPDPALNRFPDENYAREIMQLFSIGLWELNLDGTRKLDANGKPIPTYNDQDIAQYARVFTGLQYWEPGREYWWDGGESHNYPMRGYDSEHDMGPKTLLRGTVLPARNYTGNERDSTQTMLDLNATIDNLFNHPNVGPFIGRLLIQRLVTSNPTPAYISRVATAFNNDGNGVRGNMGAVVKAILIDPEARAFDKTLEPGFGKMREPYMTLLNMAKTFNAQPRDGDPEIAYMYEFYLQELFRSPSVFNFYSPNYRPPGELSSLGLFAPEFQILTAVTGVETQNNLLNSIDNQIARWGNSDPDKQLIIDLSQETALAADPDALIRKLNTRMTGGTLRPRSFQNIREAILKITPQTVINGGNWQRDRARMAAYLIGSSSEFNIQK